MVIANGEHVNSIVSNEQIVSDACVSEIRFSDIDANATLSGALELSFKGG